MQALLSLLLSVRVLCPPTNYIGRGTMLGERAPKLSREHRVRWKKGKKMSSVEVNVDCLLVLALLQQGKIMSTRKRMFCFALGSTVTCLTIHLLYCTVHIAGNM